MLVPILFGTVVVTVVASAAYQFRAAWVPLPALALATLMTCGGLGVLPIVVVVVSTLAAALCRACHVSTKGFASYCAGLTAGLFGIAAIQFLPTYREHQKLLAENPFVDVDERLSYETSTGSSDRAHAGTSRDLLPDIVPADWDKTSLYAIMTRLKPEAEHRYRVWDRARSLASLSHAHEGFVADFVAENGQGVSRMRRISARRDLIELPEPPPLELPEPPAATSESPESGREPLAALDAPEAPAAVIMELPATAPHTTTLLRTHESGLVDFVNAEGFGFVASRNQVLGFQPHAFRTIPTLADSDEKTAGWQIVRLELVSLLKHHPPAAYVSKHLPRMEELRDAPTRPLDDFEIVSLAKLRSGEELAVEATADELRMLGPLRAYHECLECHQVKTGTLLGAFTYRLRPVNRQPAPAPGRPVL